MSRYNLNQYEDDGPPWWAKVLAVLVIAGIGAVWHRLKMGYW